MYIKPNNIMLTWKQVLTRGDDAASHNLLPCEHNTEIDVDALAIMMAMLMTDK